MKILSSFYFSNLDLAVEGFWVKLFLHWKVRLKYFACRRSSVFFQTASVDWVCFLINQNTLSMCHLVAWVLGSKAVLAAHRLVFLGASCFHGWFEQQSCHPVYFLPLAVCSVQKDKHIPWKLLSYLNGKDLMDILSFLFVFLHFFLSIMQVVRCLV